MKYKNPTKLHISTPAAPTTLANSNAFKHFLTESWFSHYAANRLDLPPCSCPWDPSEQTPPPPSRWLWFVLCPSSISTSPVLFGVGGGGEGRKTEGKRGKDAQSMPGGNGERLFSSVTLGPASLRLLSTHNPLQHTQQGPAEGSPLGQGVPSPRQQLQDMTLW